jgi:prepilin-type N-terminal cleavage/methylation domain-containing protein
MNGWFKVMKIEKTQFGARTVAAGGDEPRIARITRMEECGVEAEGQRGARRGFTLVELLVVITIMGIIAAMVVGMSAMAGRKKRDAVVTAMKARLVLFINTYHSKMGFYPPDNALNATNTPGTAQYDQSTSMNSLIYELTGAPFSTSGSFTAFDGTSLSGAKVSALCGRGGIANSLPDEMHVFYQPLPNPKDYMVVTIGGSPFDLLVVPVDLNGNPTNFWHYDCSNPNRHNPQGFDLWAVYTAGTNTITNGNWNMASQ